MGDLETFSDLWDSIWQDMAKSMTGILASAFEDAFSEGGGGLGQLFGSGEGSFAQVIEQNRLAAGVGGAGMMYQGYQEGGTGGVMQGMMGGAMTGMALGGPWGAAIGAAAGGIMALFGGEDEPRVYGSLGLGGSQVNQSDTDLSHGARNVWANQRIAEYRSSITAMNDVLRLFERGDLFDMIGEAPTFTFDEGDLGEITTIFSERWLPQAMRQLFRGAINRGLRGLGVDDETRGQLWDEVRDLGGAGQIDALNTFIGSLVGLTDLYADMNWTAIEDESRQDSMSAFLGGMDDALGGIQNQMLGLDSMTLLERAEQAQTIEQMIMQARSAEIAMLQQIDSLQQSINRSIDSQIESLQVGGMSDEQARQYYAGQIDSIMASLRSGASSPEAIQQLMADLQRYVAAYQGAVGDQLYEGSPYGGPSYADELISILEEARGLSNTALEGMRDQIRESNELLISELSRLIEALQHWGDSVATGDGVGVGAAPTNITGQFDINVHAGDGFWADVDARIEAGIAANNYAGPS
jgi:hypothetical protein